ncbi:hypothetical protein GOODEAATRI_011931 [Goodea atripinnis]|uniref:Uncharacterized protein n=1 Tax=Goodea atripinnis TaxID=208336 RepID=A0ABV0NL12_9TELE
MKRWVEEKWGRWVHVCSSKMWLNKTSYLPPHSFESPEAGGTTRVLAWAGRWGGLPGVSGACPAAPGAGIWLKTKGGVWTTQRDLTARGGIQGGVPGPQVRPELNLPLTSTPPLPPTLLGASFSKSLPPPCAQQANQTIFLCHATWGPRGRRKGGG